MLACLSGDDVPSDDLLLVPDASGSRQCLSAVVLRADDQYELANVNLRLHELRKTLSWDDVPLV